MFHDIAKFAVSIFVFIGVCYVVYVYDKDQVKDGSKIMLGSDKQENESGDK